MKAILEKGGLLIYKNDMKKTRVLKFGGSSVAGPGEIRNVIGILEGYTGTVRTLVVVISAQAGITNKLVRLCDMIAGKDMGTINLINEIEEQHLATIKELVPVSNQPSYLASVITLCNELSDITRGALLVGEVTPRTRDLVLSFGERLSAMVFCFAVKELLGPVEYSDSREYIVTDSGFGSARIDFGLTNKLVREYYHGREGLIIATGFIARNASGQTTTLGRSGSDYTASVIGAALDADIVEIWSDTDGIMTADPRVVNGARTIAMLSYSEAMELSNFGARILFPASIQPAMEKKIPILVRNTFNPSHPGTMVNGKTDSSAGFIKGIASLGGISVINIEGSGMVGVAGFSARLFTSLWNNNISVILISQASSEHSICLALLSDVSERACKVIEQTFAADLGSGLISSVKKESDLAIIAVVGEQMRNRPGVAAEVFGPLGKRGINIKAISQGSSEQNISFVIREEDLTDSLNILHCHMFGN
ncbi:MAG: aspartate kinase [Bacteroidales bacterium]